MKNPLKLLFATFAVLTIACAASAFAQSKPNEKRFGLFKDHCYSMEPDIEVILKLTPEQIDKLEAARTAYLQDEELNKTREAFQADKDNLAAKQAFYAAEKQALTTYLAVVNETLTQEQQERVTAVNQLAEETWKELADIEHWGERTKKMNEIGLDRLSQVLTPEEKSLLSSDAVAPASETTPNSPETSP